MAGFIVKTTPINREKKPVTVIVGKNILKTAVGRNLLKRRVRAILLPFSKKSRKSFWVIAKPAAAKMSFQEIKKEIYDNTV